MTEQLARKARKCLQGHILNGEVRDKVSGLTQHTLWVLPLKSPETSDEELLAER